MNEKRAISPNESDDSKVKRRRSRKGLEKVYQCEEPECGKKFTRLEHLYRHQLNRKLINSFILFLFERIKKVNN